MHRFFRNIRILLAACLLTACTPARTGIVGNTLTTNVKPLVSITGLAPLSVLAHGTLRPEAVTDRMGSNEMVTFDYALFADNGETNRPVERFAYAAIVRLAHPNAWRFHPPVESGTALSSGSVSLDGLAFMHEILRTPSLDDWSSDIWRENNRDVPEQWLVKRWTAHLNESVRVVMEYREPWPDTLRPLSTSAVVASGPGADALLAFIERADAAFKVEKKGGTFDKSTPPPGTRLAIPKKDPDVAKLVGTVMARDNDS